MLNQKPKSKLKLLIITSIVAVVLITIFAIIGSTKKSPQEPQADPEIINRYANWLLYGKDSNEEFSGEEFDKTRIYAVEEKIRNSDTDFFEKAIKNADNYLEQNEQAQFDNLAYTYMQESKDLLVF